MFKRFKQFIRRLFTSPTPTLPPVQQGGGSSVEDAQNPTRPNENEPVREQ